jgi:hypothetical protein
MALSMFKTTAFAFYFIVSSCSWMGSSCFIVGPKKQFQNMKQPKRRYCASASAAEHLSLSTSMSIYVVCVVVSTDGPPAQALVVPSYSAIAWS